MRPFLLLLLLAVVCLLPHLSPVSCTLSTRIPPAPPPGPAAERLEREYLRLLDATEDKAALEAIRDLHRQLDGDQDGTIEPAETGELVRGDLFRGGDQRRGSSFHDKVRVGLSKM